MGCFLALLLVVVGVRVFVAAFRRRPDVLTGPWIAKDHELTFALTPGDILLIEKAARHHRSYDQGIP
jgi:hypothetical protein